MGIDVALSGKRIDAALRTKGEMKGERRAGS
jgi:hypothetical protein